LSQNFKSFSKPRKKNIAGHNWEKNFQLEKKYFFPSWHPNWKKNLFFPVGIPTGKKRNFFAS